jgi:tetratricopeptide (TPR) repeat protein
MRCLRLAVFAAVGLAGLATTHAHDGPEHVIDAITAELTKSGPTAELHYRRACEYRALRKYAEAETDLRTALRLDADLVGARFELARLLLRDGRFDAARTLLDPLTTSPDVALRAAALALRGELQASQGARSTAVADFTTALSLHPDVGWYLRRSQLQTRPEEADVRIAGLREGYATTQSPVLRAAWCDALVDAGAAAPEEFRLQALLNDASSIVADELATNRFLSAWLVRRARVRRLQGDAAGVSQDLHAALAELTARLEVPRPDPSLLDERAEAYRLLGDAERAEADVAAAAEVRRRIAAAARPSTRDASAPTLVEP